MGKQIVNMNREELVEECRNRGINAEESATRQELLMRVNLFDEGMRQADLEEAGYKRNEQLARRADELAERAETAGPEVYGIDPDVVAPDREILSRLRPEGMLDGSHVTNRQPGWEYCWVYYGLNSQFVWQKKYLGWRVVTGSDPECQEYKEVDGTRRIGDVLLMKIPRERYLEIEEQKAKRRDEQYLGIKARLQELSDKSGIRIYDDLSKVDVGGRNLADVMERKAAARDVAMQHIDRKLRDGDVPGIPSPKKD